MLGNIGTRLHMHPGIPPLIDYTQVHRRTIRREPNFIFRVIAIIDTILFRASECTPARPPAASCAMGGTLVQPTYNAAVRVGFRYEGTLRWHPIDRKLTGLRSGRVIQARARRDIKSLSFCADDCGPGAFDDWPRAGPPGPGTDYTPGVH